MKGMSKGHVTTAKKLLDKMAIGATTYAEAKKLDKKIEQLIDMCECESEKLNGEFELPWEALPLPGRSLYETYDREAGSGREETC